jgi:mycothiol system anti-sigma-R factor
MSFFGRLKRFFGARGTSERGVGDRGAPPGGNGKRKGAGLEMISCEEALAVLYEYLDGELEGVTEERVRAHFEVCARCYPKLAMEKSFLAAVTKAGTGEKAPQELKGKILDLIKEETAG